VAVLFSGGLDFMILAALLDECLDPSCKFCSESYVYIFFSPLNVLCYFCTYLNGLQFIGVETGKLR
jgi:asparagine synthetase B (glutamine-hydrolysing)